MGGRGSAELLVAPCRRNAAWDGSPEPSGGQDGSIRGTALLSRPGGETAQESRPTKQTAQESRPTKQTAQESRPTKQTAQESRPTKHRKFLRQRTTRTRGAPGSAGASPSQ